MSSSEVTSWYPIFFLVIDPLICARYCGNYYIDLISSSHLFMRDYCVHFPDEEKGKVFKEITQKENRFIDQFGRSTYLMEIVSLPIHEHRVSLYSGFLSFLSIMFCIC
jgi:hypothetical protein